MRDEPSPAGRSSGQRSPVLPWLLILFLGSAALGGYFLIAPAFNGVAPYYRVGYRHTAYEYSVLILLLFVPYALVLASWWRGGRAPVALLLGGAVVLHLLVLFAPPPQSQDVFQYLFYGRMWAVHGANPFTANPSAFWADPWFPWIRWNTQPSVYGPAWVLLSSGVVKASVTLAGKSLASALAAMKIFVLALDLGIMAVILRLSRDARDPDRAAGWGLLAYAWNPLVLITVPLAGSADTAVAAAFLAAILARRRGRTGLTTVLLTLAALVKVYAVIGLVLHVALLARERGTRRALGHAGTGAGLIVAGYAPFWSGLATFSGLSAASDLTNQSLTGTVQRVVFAPVLHLFGYHAWSHGAEVLARVMAGALLGWAALWAIRRTRDDRTLWTGTLVVLGAYLVLTPWFLYWYILAPLAMVAVLPHNRLTMPILTFSGTAFFTLSLPWPQTLWILQTILRYGPPFAVLFVMARRVRASDEAAGLGPWDGRTSPKGAPVGVPVAR
jgi:Glycosyltransferase family 87